MVFLLVFDQSGALRTAQNLPKPIKNEWSRSVRSAQDCTQPPKNYKNEWSRSVRSAQDCTEPPKLHRCSLHYLAKLFSERSGLHRPPHIFHGKTAESVSVTIFFLCRWLALAFFESILARSLWSVWSLTSDFAAHEKALRDPCWALTNVVCPRSENVC